MSSPNRMFAPKRKLRQEVALLALIFSVPLAIALVFPFESFNFAAVEPAAAAAPQCVIVHLTDAEERAAIAAARASWQVDRGVANSGGENLALGHLPEFPLPMVIGERQGIAVGEVAAGWYPLELMPPSVAAGRAENVDIGAGSVKNDAFPRETMLLID